MKSYHRLISICILLLTACSASESSAPPPSTSHPAVQTSLQQAQSAASSTAPETTSVTVETTQTSSDTSTSAASQSKEEVIQTLLQRASDHAKKDLDNRENYKKAAGPDNRYFIANTFIRNEFPNYFSDEDKLQKSIEYGYYVQMMGNVQYRAEGEYLIDYMGQQLTQAAQSIYLGTATPQDPEIISALHEIENSLKFLYLQFYGQNATSDLSKIDMSDMPESTKAKVAEVQAILERASMYADKDRTNLIENLNVKEADMRNDKASEFIRTEFPDYYSNEEKIKQAIEYGAYEELVYYPYAYTTQGGHKYYLMGQLLTRTAQSIYLGQLTPEDPQVTSLLADMESMLQSFYLTYYGKQ